MDLLHRVTAFCDRYALLPHGARVVVAVSGGPDSLCLLHLLGRLREARRLTLHVAHLDHRLRPDSADDARFVAEVARAWQLPVVVEQADVAALAQRQGEGLEAAARAARLDFLARAAQELGADRIALGHNADDQAETVLLRLLRGAGPGGLAAMRPRRRLDERDPDSPWLIRPLLETPRSAIEAYCAAQGLVPRRDSTNDTTIFLRNRVRGYILPLLKTYNPNIVATLGRTARICAEEDDLLQQLTRQSWERNVRVEDGAITIDRPAFAALHPALQRRIIRQAAAVLGLRLEARHLDLALAAIAAGRRRLQLPGGGWLWITGDQLRLSAPDAPQPTAKENDA